MPDYTRPLTPTMAALIEQLNVVRRGTRDSERIYREALDEETGALGAYEQAHAQAMLCSEQKTEGLRQAEATIATMDYALQKRLAISLRRSARAALSGHHHDSKVLEAAFHAYNAEMKVELSLAGREG